MAASSSPNSREYPEKQVHCEKHGDFTSYNYFGSMWSGCGKCAEEARAAAKAQQQAEEKAERLRSRLADSNLSGRFEEATFDTYRATTSDQRAVLAACREFAQTVQWKTGGGLWLIGPPGTGKTHLASAIVRWVIENRDVRAEIYTAREIIRNIRATWRNRDVTQPYGQTGRAQTEEAMIADLGYVPLLVIDEAGVGFGSEAEMVQLYDVVDERYKHKRPTVLISNLDAGDLKTALGDRAYDRLREGAKLLACKWKSHRGQPPAAPSLEVVK